MNFIYKKNVCTWIEQIGDQYDLTKISQLTGGCWSDGIYIGKNFTSDVKKLCEYCFYMFGVNKFDVAKLFELKDPSSIPLPEKSENITKMAYTATRDKSTGAKLCFVAVRTYSLSMIAAIYAEKGETKSARKYYSQSVNTLDGYR